MLNLVNQITIGGQTFDYVTEVEINSSWEMFTDTAEMTIPRKLRFSKNGEVIENIISGDNPLFKRGDAVSMVMGYSGQTASRFTGYVSNISPQNPLVFEFQDEMYTLKQKTIKSYSKTGLTLTKLITDIVGNVPFEITQEFTIGKYAIKNATVSQVLEHLKSNYGVTSFFKDGTLFCGLAYPIKDVDQIKITDIDMEQFVIDDSNLVYQRDDDQKIKIKAISIYPDNTRKEAEAGDADGGERTQYFYNVSEADLKKYAEERLEKFKYTGYTGSFVTFINPIIRQGEAVRLTSTKRPDANGVYLVKRVITRSGVNGGRQEVELDIKI